MASLVSSVASYLPFRKSAPPVEEKEEEENKENEQQDKTNENNQGESEINPEDVKENDSVELQSDKKTDELIDPSQQPGYLWRISSGVYSGVAGTVGYGVGGVKWVAGKSYDAGSAVVGTTKTVVSKVPIPTLRRKDKKE